MTEVGAESNGLILPTLESPRSSRAAYSYGPLVNNWAKRRLRMELGPWQVYSLNRILEADSDGNLLAKLALISVARQNGKSVIVRSIVGWMLDEGFRVEAFRNWHLIIMAAHDAKQARIPYDFVRRDLESYIPDISGWNRHSRKAGYRKPRSTYYTGIEINGLKVDVATRAPGSTRGISPALIAFDEVLTQTDFNMYEVLSPSQSAIPNALMLMTSTAGFADSVVLRSMHDRLYRQSTAAEQHDPTFVGLWWRADDDDVGLEWDRLKEANPALDDGRLSRAHIANEYSILPKGSWIRERLNRWHDERVDAPFTLANWGNCRVSNPLSPTVLGDNPAYTLGVDVTGIWSEGTIVVAAQRMDHKVGVEVHRHMKSRPELPLKAEDFTRQIVEFAQKYKVEQIVYSDRSPLAPAMERISVMYNLPCVPVPGTRNMLACEDFAEAVIGKRIAHDDPLIDSEIAKAQRRFVGSDGSWRWAISVSNITAVVATTFATMFAAKALTPAQLFV